MAGSQIFLMMMVEIIMLIIKSWLLMKMLAEIAAHNAMAGSQVGAMENERISELC